MTDDLLARAWPKFCKRKEVGFLPPHGDPTRPTVSKLTSILNAFHPLLPSDKFIRFARDPVHNVDLIREALYELTSYRELYTPEEVSDAMRKIDDDLLYAFFCDVFEIAGELHTATAR